MNNQHKLTPDTERTFDQEGEPTTLDRIAAKNRAFEKSQAAKEREAIAEKLADVLEERKLARRKKLTELKAEIAELDGDTDSAEMTKKARRELWAEFGLIPPDDESAGSESEESETEEAEIAAE